MQEAVAATILQEMPRILKKNDDAFIINSGLPLIEEIKLQVYLKISIQCLS